MEKVHQVWFETKVGPIFSTKQKAITWLEKDGDRFDENDPSGYPAIKELDVDTGYVYNHCVLMDR